jgi:uncharacterized protein involved in exopolysaccharide biosynthesis
MEEYEVSLKDYIDVIWKEKIIIAIILALSLVSALIFSIMQPNVYETRTTLMITPRIAEELEGAQATATVPSFYISPETYEKLAVTNDILVGIIKELQLKGNSEELTVEALRSMMTPRIEMAEKGKTLLPLLTMKVKGTNPEELRDIADAWGRLFIEKNTELLSTRTAQSYEFISERFEEVSNDLRKKEEEKIKYMEENPLSTLQTELTVAKTTYEERLSMLDAKRRELNESAARLKSLEEEIKDEPEFLQWSAPSASWIVTAEALKNPTYFSLKESIIETKVFIDTTKGEISYLEEEVRKLKSEIDEKEARINEIQIILDRMDREISSLKSAYDFLSDKLLEARIAKEEQLQSIKIVEEPVVPQVPTGPSKILNIAIASILGLFVGIFAAFFKNYMEE